MINRSLAGLTLLLAIQTTAVAEIYRCELADGTVIFGDRPVNLSDQCQPVSADSAKEYLSIQQGTTGRSTSDQPVVSEPEDERKAATATPQSAWTARATTLVESYNEARKRRIRESYLVNKRKAMRDMAMLIAEKKAMLAELQESALGQQEREKIRGILAEIPEDSS